MTALRRLATAALLLALTVAGWRLLKAGTVSAEALDWPEPATAEPPAAESEAEIAPPPHAEPLTERLESWVGKSG